MSIAKPYSLAGAGTQLAAFFIGTAMPVSLFCWNSASSGGLAKHPELVPICMLTPMLSAMLVQKLSRRPILGDGGLGFAWGRLRWWVLAPLCFAAYVVASLAISVFVSTNLLASASEVARNVNHLAIPHNFSVPAQVGLAIATTLVIGPLVNLPIFLGEEVGWRGFMNPRLLAIFGRPGLIVGGGVWALWHLPFILLGHNYPQHPWLGLAVWVPICICLNILLAAVRQSSRSIFACALSHGVINQLATLLLVVFINEKSFIDTVHGPAGIIGLVLLLAPTVWTYRRLDPSLMRKELGAPSRAATRSPKLARA